MDFSGKFVLVTGGSRGIGKAVSTAFASKGACVAVQYNSNHEAAEETVSSLPGGAHFSIQADISKPEAIEPLIRAVHQRFGRLDIVVNNAGIFVLHPIEYVEYDQWQSVWKETLGLNLIGTANMMYWASQYMIKQGGGRIINISSRGAFRGEPEAPAYGASKAGLNALSQSLAQQLAKYNIFIGIVAPGFVDTDRVAEFLNGPRGNSIKNQSPLGRVAKPEEVAHAVLFLASEGAEFMTGSIIDVNGASYLRS